MINGNSKNMQYSVNIRRFCLQQYYYSPAAYIAMRSFFNKNLPAKRTLQLWYASIDASPGIQNDALNTLRERAESYQKENQHQLHVSLMSDETSIRKEVVWREEIQSFDGFCTIVSSSQHAKNETLKVAKDALVFMVVGPDFKIPVAYYLLCGLDAPERAALTLQVIKCIEETMVRVISFTTDGLRANITVAELLGAKLQHTIWDHTMEPYIKSPTYDGQKIYVILDNCHMIKLVRKHFSEAKLYHENKLIDWNLLKILEKKQRKDNFNLCNKLSDRHIKWSHKPMNVLLAMQTISKSLSDVLVQLQKDGYEEFKNAAATAEFLLMFNDGTDVFNVEINHRMNNRYKQPLRNDTAEKKFSFLENLKEYIEQIQVETTNGNGKVHQKPVLNSSISMGFFGFYINAISLKGIYEDFVKNGPFEEFYTMQFSQDHLETFFSLIRNSNGSNDNPNAIEFKSAFRKLLICHPLLTSKGHNVIPNTTKILNVPSTRKSSLPNAVRLVREEVELDFTCCYEDMIFSELQEMDAYDEHLCAYVALEVEKKIIRKIECHTKITCAACADVFKQNIKISDELIRSKNEGSSPTDQPCLSTLKIIVFVNAIHKIMPSIEAKCIRMCICNNLDLNDLYATSNFEDHQLNKSSQHKEEFVSEVVKTYMDMKSMKIGNRITIEDKGLSNRYINKKLIHVEGH